MVNDLISDDIKANHDRYVTIMHDHGRMSADEIIDSLRETQHDLFNIYQSVSDEDAQRQPAPGEWSLHELALHTVFTERLIAKLIHHASRGTIPSPEDLEGAGIGMMPRENTQTYDEILDDLRRTNTDILEAVADLPEEPNLEMKPPHPYFGPLTCLEWAGFQRVHDLDHIQHAQKIIAAITA
jgi:hypothetical protein